MIYIMTACSGKSTNLITADDASAGSTIEMRVGDKLDVKLEGNPTTGYNWTIESVDSQIIKQLGESEFKQNKQSQNLVGAGGSIIHHFEAIKSGQTQLKLIYHRPWETDVAPIKIFEITIVVR